MNKSTGTAWYGWRPDAPDKRDRLYAEIAPPPRRLPVRVDLRRWCSPVESQGSIGSCTAHALVGSLEFLERKAGRRVRHLSRLFVYFNARVLEGTAATDDGAMIRNGVKTLRNQGVCPETLWPYRVRRFAEPPPADCYRAAADHQVLSYHRVRGLQEMRQCLAEGFPFVFGMTTYASFEGPQVARSGHVELPRRGEAEKGGHSVCAVGYDDRARRFLMRNSWGSDWGHGGYFTLPYEYAELPRLASDFWTLRAFEGV
jgi:C1A family cysteine protease